MRNARRSGNITSTPKGFPDPFFNSVISRFVSFLQRCYCKAKCQHGLRQCWRWRFSWPTKIARSGCIRPVHPHTHPTQRHVHKSESNGIFVLLKRFSISPFLLVHPQLQFLKWQRKPGFIVGPQGVPCATWHLTSQLGVLPFCNFGHSLSQIVCPKNDFKGKEVENVLSLAISG